MAEILRRAGYNPTLVPTRGPATAGALAREAVDRGADLILAAGGDGTINEVLPGLVHTSVPLGILPAGTANVLAMEMQLGSHMETVARKLAECRPQRIALGCLSGAGVTPSQRHFLLMCGAGLDAHIVYHLAAGLKSLTGKFAYWVGGVRLAGRRLEEFQATVDGRPYRTSFALVSRVRNYGGDLEIARETSLFDDRFEVVLFEGRHALRYLKYLLAVASIGVGGVRGVTVLRARRVSLTPSADRAVYLQVDGEYAGHLPATVELMPDALTLLVPPEYRRRREQDRLAENQGASQSNGTSPSSAKAISSNKL